MGLRVGRLELRTASVGSVRVRQGDALRDLGRALMNDVPRLRPAQHRTGQLGRLVTDGWTSEQVQQFINIWPTASATTLVKLLHSANAKNHGTGGVDVAPLAAAVQEQFGVDGRGHARRRS